jgi:protein-S-isoprenylcysteine O-methyltransferase Ste14
MSSGRPPFGKLSCARHPSYAGLIATFLGLGLGEPYRRFAASRARLFPGVW